MQQKEGSQQTIKNRVEFRGIALHSGEEVTMRLLPAPSDYGIVFRRIDLSKKPEIAADPDNVVSTTRCTSIGLKKGGETVVHTVEHIMAALWSYKIDNVIVEINNAETPVGDGSAYPFVELLAEAGCKKQQAARLYTVVERPIWVRHGPMYMVLLPYDGFKVTYTLEYNHPAIGTQFREFEGGTEDFTKEIARARTFGFKKEVEVLHRRGLALGGSLENAVLIGENETVNSLRFQDEFVRHKILDVIGDMALNSYIKGHIIAVRSGHSLHVELAKKIKKQAKEEGESS